MKPKVVQLIPLSPPKVNILCRMNRLDFSRRFFVVMFQKGGFV